eukprot:Sspe_Gene.34930::Locus_16961_Transcript_2_3_Confidence_0.429_Length_2264::g.34930::m.34930
MSLTPRGPVPVPPTPPPQAPPKGPHDFFDVLYDIAREKAREAEMWRSRASPTRRCTTPARPRDDLPISSSIDHLRNSAPFSSPLAHSTIMTALPIEDFSASDHFSRPPLPEPPPPPALPLPPPPPSLPQPQDPVALSLLRQKLVWFYKRFNPAKLPLIDRIIVEQGGVHGIPAIHSELVRRYEFGEEYLMWYDALEDFYRAHNPEKEALVGPILEEWRGKEAKLFKTLEKKYHTNFFRQRGLLTRARRSEPPSPAELFLRDAYATHCPQMLPFVPTLLSIYRNRPADLVAAVAVKFGLPIPPGIDNIADDPAGVPPAHVVIDSLSSLPLSPAPPPSRSVEGSGAKPITTPRKPDDVPPVQHEAGGKVPHDLAEMMNEKDTLIKAQMHLIEDYALQLEQKRSEASAHEQTVEYLRHLHTRAQGVIERLARHVREVWSRNPPPHRHTSTPPPPAPQPPASLLSRLETGNMDVGELEVLCRILGIGMPRDDVPGESSSGPTAKASTRDTVPYNEYMAYQGTPYYPPPPPPSQPPPPPPPVPQYHATDPTVAGWLVGPNGRCVAVSAEAQNGTDPMDDTLLPSVNASVYEHPTASLPIPLDDEESLPATPPARASSL